MVGLLVTDMAIASRNPLQDVKLLVVTAIRTMESLVLDTISQSLYMSTMMNVVLIASMLTSQP